MDCCSLFVFLRCVVIASVLCVRVCACVCVFPRFGRLRSTSIYLLEMGSGKQEAKSQDRMNVTALSRLPRAVGSTVVCRV
jgi:hypothetical protein